MKSFFTALLPVIPDGEPERFYYHPTHPQIYCNQIGVLYFSEDIYLLSECRAVQYLIVKSTRERVAKRDIVVYQCYSGAIQKFSKMLFRNGNPNDLSVGNIITSLDCPKKDIKTIKEAMQDFIDETAIDLYLLETKYVEKYGIPPTELHDKLMLPQWVRNLSRIFIKANDQRSTGIKGIIRLPNGTFKAIPYNSLTKTRKYLGIYPTTEEAAEAIYKWKTQM